MGWTDDPTLLSNGCDNRWQSEAEALAACDELAHGLGVFRDALRVVPIDPENYSEEPSVPTVQDILDSTAIGNGFHDFAVEGGTVRVSTETLRAALETYHDPEMANWVALIDESGFDA
jgi:uncharacterized protein YbbK (DUF523 family)